MNKTALLLLLSSVCSAPAIAREGARYIGGDVGIFSSSGHTSDTSYSSATSTFSWSIAPEAGLYLSDRVQAGASLSFGSEKRDNNYSGSSTIRRTTTFGGGAYLRYYLTNGVLRPFAGLGLHAYAGKTKADYNALESNSFGINGTLNAGFAYNLSPRFAAFASLAALGFSHSESKAKDGSGGKDVNNNFSLFGSTNASTFNLGVQYLIPRHKNTGASPAPAESR